MRKILCLLFAVSLVLVSASGVMAYSYSVLNNTTIQDSNGSWGNPAWNGRTNPIQSGPFFNTYGADWAGGVLTIYTNWNPTLNGIYGSPVSTADLIIDVNGDKIWDFSVGLDPGNNGFPVRISNYYTGADKPTTPFGLYGVNVDIASPHPIVTGKPNQETQFNVPVLWSPSTKDGTDQVAITLGNLAGNNFHFMWASGTCGNGPIEGTVPLPPSVLLMGSGLLGLGLLRFRRKNAA